VRVRFATDVGATVWGVDLPVVDSIFTSAEASVVGHLGPDPLRADWYPDEAVARLAA
jgi:hypothetical protein